MGEGEGKGSPHPNEPRPPAPGHAAPGPAFGPAPCQVNRGRTPSQWGPGRERHPPGAGPQHGSIESQASRDHQIVWPVPLQPSPGQRPTASPRCLVGPRHFSPWGTVLMWPQPKPRWARGAPRTNTPAMAGTRSQPATYTPHYSRMGNSPRAPPVCPGGIPSLPPIWGPPTCEPDRVSGAAQSIPHSHPRAVPRLQLGRVLTLQRKSPRDIWSTESWGANPFLTPQVTG